MLPRASTTPTAFVSRSPRLPKRGVRFAKKEEIIETDDSSSDDSYAALLTDDTTPESKRVFLDQKDGSPGHHVICKVFVNGDLPVYAHADSGATSTLINLDYVKMVGLSDMIEYYKTDSPSYTVAHGGVASFLGRIPRLGIKLADHIEMFLSVHVVPRAPYTLLLGADFLTGVGGVIDYSTGEFHYRYDPGDGNMVTST